MHYKFHNSFASHLTNSISRLHKQMSVFSSLMPILFLFIFIFIAPFSYSISEHNSHYIKNSLFKTNSLPQQYFEITRPLPFTNLTPTCILPIFTHDFAYTMGHPPISITYFPPNCTWTHVALQLNVSSKGVQYDRIAAVWLDGAELLRTSTPEPTENGVYWTVTKDVTRYTSIMVKSNISLSVMLENLVNDVYTGVYHVNISFLYYNVNDTNYSNGNMKTTLKELKSEMPADLIYPISRNGSEGCWFRIMNGSEVHGKNVLIPKNTYKAVLEIYVSYHGYDEFWYANPPDEYILNNSLSSKRGNGAYREVLLNVDGNLVGSVVPFPVIFTGGINPLCWEPLVSIGAFDLPSYDIDLTTFLGLLLDGKSHFLGLKVADSIPFWLVDANLHLWLDTSSEVQAKVLDLGTPKFKFEQSSSFLGLGGLFEIEMKRKSEISSWVNSTAGSLTTIVKRELKFKNKIQFCLNGTEKTIKQEVEEEIEVEVKSDGSTISQTKVNRKYPLTLTSKTLPSAENGTSFMISNLDHEWREKKSNGDSQSSLTNRQVCFGWMVVQDHNVSYGGATTQQSYSYSDVAGSYSRIITANFGKLMDETATSLSAAPLESGSVSAF